MSFDMSNHNIFIRFLDVPTNLTTQNNKKKLNQDQNNIFIKIKFGKLSMQLTQLKKTWGFLLRGICARSYFVRGENIKEGRLSFK